MVLEPPQNDFQESPDSDGSPPLLTWLASYPRSGNTLLRIILSSCFGQLSQSIYSDAEFSDPAVLHVIGSEAVGPDPQHFLNLARQRKRSLFVKTHELPGTDNHRAIYVLRDGRSCVVSHFHFLTDILHRNVSLADVILGKCGVPWSDHVKAWTMIENPAALVVRYEDLAVGDAQTLERISHFIGRPVFREFDISFVRLHARSPLFFRSGSDRANIAELQGENLELFERIHGATLRRVGYGEHSERDPVKGSSEFERGAGLESLQASSRLEGEPA